jgi:hypothetical protein
MLIYACIRASMEIVHGWGIRADVMCIRRRLPFHLDVTVTTEEGQSQGQSQIICRFLDAD